jgi:L-threonylcarbamoyladenylate synthase
VSRLVSIERDGPADARQALEDCVRDGGTAVFPADGLYGLACDPTNPEAISRIHEIKAREKGKPSAVMYFSAEAIDDLLERLAPLTRAAIVALLPGPATLVVYNPGRVFPHACGDEPEQLGVRWIEGPLAGVGVPIFQTSANQSGEPPPASIDQVDPGILDAVDLAIDGGTLSGVPSTVVDLTAIEAGGAWEVLREGGMPYEALERALTRLSLG